MMDAANHNGAALTEEQRAAIQTAADTATRVLCAGGDYGDELTDPGLRRDLKAARDALCTLLAAPSTERAGLETLSKLSTDALAQLSTETVDKPVNRMSDAERDVLAERTRQVGAEGFTPTHDDQHDDGVLVCAAIAYAGADTVNYPINEPPDMWPWASEWWKPADDRRNLVKAAALLIAEIERLDRAGGGDADAHA